MPARRVNEPFLLFPRSARRIHDANADLRHLFVHRWNVHAISFSEPNALPLRLRFRSHYFDVRRLFSHWRLPCAYCEPGSFVFRSHTNNLYDLLHVRQSGNYHRRVWTDHSLEFIGVVRLVRLRRQWAMQNKLFLGL